jgi:hypothetical protein
MAGKKRLFYPILKIPLESNICPARVSDFTVKFDYYDWPIEKETAGKRAGSYSMECVAATPSVNYCSDHHTPPSSTIILVLS